jgi:membrane fusion protein, heavy metal efflux system
VGGEIVDPMRPTFGIADIRRMWLTLDLSKENAGRVALGQSIHFETAGDSQGLDSRITWISTEIDKETRTLNVRAEVENPLVTDPVTGESRGRLLRAQTFGTGRIILSASMAACVVPRSCIQWDGVRHIVFVQVNDTSFESVIVEPGITNHDFTEVSGDLSAGARVVNLGSHTLKSALMFSRMETAAN